MDRKPENRRQFPVQDQKRSRARFHPYIPEVQSAFVPLCPPGQKGRVQLWRRARKRGRNSLLARPKWPRADTAVLPEALESAELLLDSRPAPEGRPLFLLGPKLDLRWYRPTCRPPRIECDGF